MDPTRVIDSHIHLWPASMSNEKGHSWMTKGMPLAKEHLLKDYYKASQQQESIVEGVVYIETDVRYNTPSADLSFWAEGPLTEILFLRAIVEGKYGERDSQILKAIVPWAPMDQPTPVLEEWFNLAEKTAGPETWKRVKGFRFLLQGILNQTSFENLVFSQDFISNLQLLGRRNVSFDIGVDQHSGGIRQLQAITRTMSLAHENVQEKDKIVFILNHLCKPTFAPSSEAFAQWKEAMETMSKFSKTYMKLSGAFSEIEATTTTTTESISKLLKPWVGHVLFCFGAKRTMFGSDWPVCNVKGPRGEDSWAAWREVVESILEDEGLSKDDRRRVWKGTAMEAYGINL